MACGGCGQRRVLTAQALSNLKAGNTAAARVNAQNFVKTIRNDIRSIKSTMLKRPPTRGR
jgi:hypothetical protein